MSSITTPTESPPRHYRLAELARIWGKHPSAFTRYILQPKTDRRTGEKFALEAIKTPGEWLVPPGAVEAYFDRITASRKGEPAPAAPSVTAARARELAGVDAQLVAAGIRRPHAETPASAPRSRRARQRPGITAEASRESVTTSTCGRCGGGRPLEVRESSA